MAVDKQYILPTGGMNMDTDENSIPENQATFIKNHINAVNNLEDGASGGQSTNALTPYPSVSTNFDNAYLPHLRSYTIDLSAIVYPATFISFVADTTEYKNAQAITNVCDLDAIMVGSGFTITGTPCVSATYSISDTPLIYQKVIWRTNANDYYSSTLFTQTATGAANGDNICIGSYYDVKLNQLVWLNYNSNNRHNIQLYNADADSYTTVMETPLFNFSRDYRVSSIDLVVAQIQDILNTTATDSRLLYWTDKHNQPRKINIDRAIANDYWNRSNYLNYRTDDEFMLQVKYPPQTRINGTLLADTSTQQDYVDSNSYQFAQNFTFDDGEHSTYGVISTLIIARTNDGKLIFNNQYLGLNNIDAGSSIVRKINLAYRIGNTGDWRNFQIIDRDNWLNNSYISQHIYSYSPLSFLYSFKNQNAYDIIDQTSASKLYDAVPLLSGAQELLSNNSMAHGNILEGYDNISALELAKPTITITYPTVFEATEYSGLTYEEGFQATRNTNGIVYNVGNIGTYVPEPFPFQDDSTGTNHNVDGYYNNTNYRYTAHTSQGYNFKVTVNWSYITADIRDYYVYAAIKRYTSGGVLISTTSQNGTNHLAGTTGNFTDNFTFSIAMNNTDYVDMYIVVTHAVGALNGTFSWQFTSGSVFKTLLYANQILKGGGNYRFGIIYYDDANRSSYVQTNDQLNKYINTIMENGGYYLQSIVANLNGMVFPTGAKKFTICRTKDTTINRADQKGFIQWVLSSVVWTDTLGNVYADAVAAQTAQNTSGQTILVKIKIEGLDIYNTQNYNQTSTTYQFVDGDRITLMNSIAGGAPISPATYGIISKDLRSTDGLELIFDFDDRLATLQTNGTPLQAGSVVQIWTPSIDSQNNLFYEITQQYDIDQTTHTYAGDITLKTWDTYYLYRSKYPLKAPTAGNFFSTTVESPSFSDTIFDSQGEDIGRVNVVNENAAQAWYPSLVRYSYPYVQDTAINGLSTYDSSRKKDFYRQYGDIVRLYCEQYNLAIIQQEKAFRTMVARSLITTATGENTVALTNEVLSDAIEIQGNFGLQNGEAFYARHGMLYGWDLKRGAMWGGTFDKIEDISALYDKDGNAEAIKTYATIQSKSIFNFNNSSHPFYAKIFIHCGYDPKLKQVLFTNFEYDSEPPIRLSYINNNPSWIALTNDTVAFNESGYWQGFFSFTPEMYGSCEGHRYGNALVSFKQGVPYFHNLNNETTYLNFYGTTCDKYLEVVSNKGGATEKNFMNIAIDSKSKNVNLQSTKYEAVSVKTSNNQLSTIPLSSWQTREGIFFSNFYRNTSLGKTLATGDKLVGTWCKVLLKGDSSQNSNYNEVRSITFLFNESKYTN